MKRITMFLFLFTVCLALIGCYEKYSLPDKIPDAENALFTNNGRLFVTGGDNIFEISADGSATGLCTTGDYNFTGIAQVGSYLYTIGSKSGFDCSAMNFSDINFSSPEAIANFAFKLKDVFMETVLLCAEITTTDDMAFRNIHTFEDTLIPNGMVADSAGRLYVADETFIPAGKIMRLHLDDLDNPQDVTYQETWLDSSDNVHSPNGMSIQDDIIYFTDFNMSKLSTTPASVKKVSINSIDTCAAYGNDDCSGNIYPLYEGSLLYDDLSAGTLFGRDVVLVASYFKGSLLFIEDDEENGKNQKNFLHETRHGMFASPSSVTFGNGLMFSNDELIVTEKGIVMELNSNIGNKVSVVYKK